MKNYEPIEKQQMAEAHEGAVIFWLSIAFCTFIAASQ